jgi:DNA-binding FadR family transcriptional regulator
MVIQRDKPIRFWGWAEPGEKVSVTFGGQTQSATAAAFDHAAPEARVVAEMAAQHRAILEALIARRWGRAREALVGHIRAQKPILLRILRTGDPGSSPAEAGR